MGLRKRPIIGITMDIEGRHFKLKQQYVSSVIKAGGMPFLIGGSQTPALAIDGLLIPGGDDLEPMYYNERKRFPIKIVDRLRTDLEINLIREIIELRKPLLGICYGMQVINVSLGGSLYQDIKSEMPHALNHKKHCHSIEIKKGGPLPEGRYTVRSAHHQAVKKLGRGLCKLAESDDGLIEAFYMKGYPFLLGVQWHPEKEAAKALSNKIFNVFINACAKK